MQILNIAKHFDSRTPLEYCEVYLTRQSLQLRHKLKFYSYFHLFSLHALVTSALAPKQLGAKKYPTLSVGVYVTNVTFFFFPQMITCATKKLKKLNT